MENIAENSENIWIIQKKNSEKIGKLQNNIWKKYGKYRRKIS
jgi:hypothetical protein